MRNGLHMLRYFENLISSWWHCLGTLGGVALMKEVLHAEWALGLNSPTLFSALFSCFMFVVESETSELPAPAAYLPTDSAIVGSNPLET